jgi:molybdopterin-guanine dinucleotide biosynthesis protein A
VPRGLAIILAGGGSERFRTNGHTTPKPLLNVEFNGVTRSMIEHVAATVPGELVQVWALPDWCPCPPGVPKVNIKDSVSQVDTLIQTLRKFPLHEQSVLLLDCDTVLDPRDLLRVWRSATEHAYRSSVAVTRSDDPNMSRVDSVPFPSRFVEKQLISPWGIVSARAFSNAECLRLVTSPHFVDLAQVLNAYPGERHAVELERPWLDWGTPERLERTGARIV